MNSSRQIFLIYVNYLTKIFHAPNLFNPLFLGLSKLIRFFFVEKMSKLAKTYCNLCTECGKLVGSMYVVNYVFAFRANLQSVLGHLTVSGPLEPVGQGNISLPDFGR